MALTGGFSKECAILVVVALFDSRGDTFSNWLGVPSVRKSCERAGALDCGLQTVENLEKMPFSTNFLGSIPRNPSTFQ